MTITANGQTSTVTDVELLERLFRQQGDFLPRREWLQWHVEHQTSLSGIFNTAGVTPPTDLQVAVEGAA